MHSPPDHKRAEPQGDTVWSGVPAHEREALRRLSALGDDFSAHEAEDVAGVDTADLVRWAERRFLALRLDGRFEMPATLRSIAYEDLQRDPRELDAVRTRLGAWHVGWLRKHADSMLTANQVATRDVRRFRGVLGALRLLAHTRPAELLEMLDRTASLAIRLDLAADAVTEFLHLAHDLPNSQGFDPGVTDALRVELLLALARLEIERGGYRDALEHARLAADAAVRLGADHLAATLATQARCHFELHDRKAAAVAARHALEAHPPSSEPGLCADGEAHLVLADIALARGRGAEANGRSESALHSARRDRNRRLECAALRGIARASLLTHDLEVARGFSERAVVLARATGSKREVARGLLVFGTSLACLDAFPAARTALEDAVELERSRGAVAGEAGAALQLGRLLGYLCEFETAERVLGGALERLEDSAVSLRAEAGRYADAVMNRVHVPLLAELAFVHELQGDHVRAGERARQAEAAPWESIPRSDRQSVCGRIGHVFVGTGEFEAARRMFERGMSSREPFLEDEQLPCLAGLVAIDMAAGSLGSEKAQLERLVGSLGTAVAYRVQMPFRVFRTAFEALRALDDERARDVLDRACARLVRAAGGLPEGRQRSLFVEGDDDRTSLQSAKRGWR